MVEFTTASGLVDIKIERNKALIDLLDSESSVLKKGILINYRWVEHNTKKIKLIEEINTIEEKQRQFYCPTRQEEIASLTNRVNTENADIMGLINDINILKEKCTLLLTKIYQLNAQIPDQIVVTNYRVAGGELSDCHGHKKI